MTFPHKTEEKHCFLLPENAKTKKIYKKINYPKILNRKEPAGADSEEKKHKNIF